MAKKRPIEETAREWIELKAQAKALEKRLEELKPELESALRATFDGSADWAGWRFTLVESERESFSLSKARAAGVDGRTLAPYISTSKSVQIRTSWQGGEAAAA